ncbi:solute carrier family 23 member 2-like isoform X2 [Rattus norvegicus]|uniref:solute carrier family 23 member 2-like isoform X2 n=1 Tax=Rattus norvegicus TaxID=10116 RepID=UPI0019177D65|nr:solute carrier family 23 member 2-like isoform X2 [Rattus norvegicus]
MTAQPPGPILGGYLAHTMRIPAHQSGCGHLFLFQDHLPHRALFSVPQKRHGSCACLWRREEVSHLQVQPVSGLPCKNHPLSSFHSWLAHLEQVLLALCLSWLFCFVLTVTNTFPESPTAYGYMARTDTKGSVLSQAPWFRFPYPGQWGLPTISLAGVFGIIAGVISSMVESVGDYHACARLVGAPPPPKHAINRGIGIEGLGCLLAGAWGTGNGTTSYSENVGALGITRVGSRMVIVAAGCVLLLMGMFGKIGAAFATIPTPVIGGMFLVMFGIISAVGISNLQYVDMNSSRNLFVFGFSIFCGLAVPNWVNKNPEKLQTGILQLDQVIQVLLTTGMFVGGFLGFVLDNTIPGSLEERGLLAWGEIQEDSEETPKASKVYGLPWGIGTKFCTSSCTRILPFWPRIDHHGDEVGASQLTLCSQTSSGKHPWSVTETKM